MQPGMSCYLMLGIRRFHRPLRPAHRTAPEGSVVNQQSRCFIRGRRRWHASIEYL